MRMAIEDEMGERIDDKQFIVALGTRVAVREQDAITAAGGVADSAAIGALDNEANDKHNALRPSHVIHISTCRDCKRAWQSGAGVRIEVPATVLARAECDAIVCDEETGARATHSVSAVTKRKVFERDEYRCRVPGCRSARNLDVHHVVHREHGGTNDLSNLVLLCRGHHKLHHDDLLVIAGRAPDELTFTRKNTPLAHAAWPFDDAPRAPVTLKELGRVIEEALR
jgi:hypothetical protein